MGRFIKQPSLVLLALFAAFAVLLYSAKTLAATVARSDYQVSTVFRNNGADVVNRGSYGESKFIITPTFKILDSLTLKKGDVIEYKLPDQLQFDLEVSRELKSTDATGEVHFATLTTSQATKTASIEIVDPDFFARLGNNKTISADITAVWDRDVMPLNQAQTFNLEGYGNITLTRIVIDEEPRGISKWGVQRSDDPSVIEWRIRVNRDLNDMTNVSITDVIRPGQELVGTVRGHYFHDYYNPSSQKPNVSLTDANSTITVTDSRHFSIKFEDMTAKGAFIYYQTRLVNPSTVEASTTNIYNDVTLYKDGADSVVPFTGQAKISHIGGSGTADTTAVTADITVNKELTGRTQALQNEEFEFELVDAKNAVLTTAKNDAKGKVTFSQVRFTAQGDYQYKIREKKAGQTESGVTYSSEEIPVTVKVTADAQNKLEANVIYPADTKLTNTYKAAEASADIEVKTSLTGKQLAENQFEFELLNQDGKVLATAKNAADGTVIFPGQTFDAAGTVNYQIRQKNGGQTIDGITYDNLTADITVSVADDNKGQLKAELTYPLDISFDNTYKVNPTSLDIVAAKILTGRDALALADGEFSFSLTSQDGNQVYQTSNKADGKIIFEAIPFAAAGTYRFNLTEIAGTDNQINYDSKIYPVEVTVTDKGDGSLSAAVTSEAITFTNSYSAGKTTVPISIAWDDADNQDGKRLPVLVRLYADGVDTGKTVTLDADNSWAANFTDVDADKGGAAITYSVAAEKVDGYNSKATSGDARNGFVLHYQRTPETIAITAKKNWEDDNNQDGKRPSQITIKLLADGQEVDQKTVSPDAAGKWETVFANKPKYAKGKEIVYTVDEEAVAEYTKTITDFTITNSRDSEKVDYQVTKIWEDNNNQDGKRPTSIKVQLYQSVSGAPVNPVVGRSMILTAGQAADSNTWSGLFSNLPKYQNGQEIAYSVQEDTNALPAGYSASVSGQTITNTYSPATVQISGSHTWDDADNQDGIRPDKVTVEVRDGSGQVVASQEVAVDADGKWNFNFADLPQYANGQEIQYQVQAKAMDGYTTTITEDDNQKGQYSLVHSHSPEQLPISGTVNWIDTADQDGLRPNSLTITLLADGKPVATATASATDNWQYTFDPVDRYKDGQEIQYSIDAAAPNGYKVQIDGFAVTQVHTPTSQNSNSSGSKSTDSSTASDPAAKSAGGSASQASTKATTSKARSTASTKPAKNSLPKTGTENSLLLILLGGSLGLLAVGGLKRKY